MTHALIKSFGSAQPSWRLSNDELVKLCGLGVDAAWIEERTGIKSRCWLPEGETTSDLATSAAARILASAALEPRQVERLILATVSPDSPSPSTATRVLRKLGARCPAYDLSATCAGFLYALDAGVAAVHQGEDNVLVLCAEARSRYVDRSDHRAAVVFGDAAAGVLLTAGDRRGVIATHLGAEGMEMLGAHVRAGGAELPASHQTVAEGLHFLRLDGAREIFEHFLRLAEEAVSAVLGKASLSIDDVDLLVPHQGNGPLTRAIAERVGMPFDRTVDVIAHHGNTSGASLPLALADLEAAGRLEPGMIILMVAVGAGAAFGASLYEVPKGT